MFRPRVTTASRAPAALLAACLGIAACGLSSSPTPLPTPRPTVAPTATPPVPSPSTGTGGPSPSSVPPSPAAGEPAGVTITLEPVVAGLAAPLFATHAGDGSGRLFVVEQGGTIRIVRDGRLADEPFLDIASRVAAGGERGLLGLAFPPGFGSGGAATFYVDYTNRDGDTEIAAIRTSPTNPDRADPDSLVVLLRIRQPFSNHNGGMIAFGPDGMLYIGTGDGGSGGDPQGNGQNPEALLGKMLRIDVSPPAGDRAYTIPPDNPFVHPAGSAAAGQPSEVWSLGLRNPWRFSFDRATGQLWIGDVGQNAWEEVDRAPGGDGRGANYGWNRMEGRHCYDAPIGCDGSGLVGPVAEYDHDTGCTVVGGHVSRGRVASALDGVYLFGDYCTGTVWGLASGGPDEQSPIVLGETGRTISSFGEDEAGELYVTDIAAGELLRVVASPRP